MSSILFSPEPPLVVISLNRPEKRNALNPQLISDLSTAFSQAESDPQCRAVILRGEGKAFCAGMDLESLQEIATQSYEKNLEDSRRLAALYKRIYTLTKPVIVVVTGPAVAGGCGLATVCDFTLATSAARFGYTEVKIGFVAAVVSVFLLPLVGEKQARDLLLSGRLIDAAEAQRIGLVNEIVGDDQILARARELALELAANSPQALATTKQFISKLSQPDLDAALESACAANAAARSTADCREGVRAFLEKRKPKWD